MAKIDNEMFMYIGFPIKQIKSISVTLMEKNKSIIKVDNEKNEYSSILSLSLFFLILYIALYSFLRFIYLIFLVLWLFLAIYDSVIYAKHLKSTLDLKLYREFDSILNAQIIFNITILFFHAILTAFYKLNFICEIGILVVLLIFSCFKLTNYIFYRINLETFQTLEKEEKKALDEEKRKKLEETQLNELLTKNDETIENMIPVIMKLYQWGIKEAKQSNIDKAVNILNAVLPKIELAIKFSIDYELTEVKNSLEQKREEIKLFYSKLELSTFTKKFGYLKEKIMDCDIYNQFVKKQEYLLEIKILVEKRLDLIQNQENSDEFQKLTTSLVEIKQNIFINKFYTDFKHYENEFNEIKKLAYNEKYANSIRMIKNLKTDFRKFTEILHQNLEIYPDLHLLLAECQKFDELMNSLKHEISDNYTQILQGNEGLKIDSSPYATNIIFGTLTDISYSNDLIEFIQNLDDQFEEWDENSLLKIGKKNSF